MLDITTLRAVCMISAPDVLGQTLPFVCPGDHFQCPSMYCIPLRYVCDGQWHCPNGEEEIDCGMIYSTLNNNYWLSFSETCACFKMLVHLRFIEIFKMTYFP